MYHVHNTWYRNVPLPYEYFIPTGAFGNLPSLLEHFEVAKQRNTVALQLDIERGNPVCVKRLEQELGRPATNADLVSPLHHQILCHFRWEQIRLVSELMPGYTLSIYLPGNEIEAANVVMFMRYWHAYGQPSHVRLLPEFFRNVDNRHWVRQESPKMAILRDHCHCETVYNYRLRKKDDPRLMTVDQFNESIQLAEDHWASGICWSAFGGMSEFHEVSYDIPELTNWREVIE